MSGSDMAVFKLNPKGQVKISLSWSPQRTDFMSGKSQHQRRRINAKKSYSFTVCGGRRDYDWLISFYNEHYGQLKPFVFNYDGKSETVYFGSALSVKVKREVGRIIGFTADVSLDIDKRGKVTKATPSESDILPKATANVTYSSDWNTKIYTEGASTNRRKEYKRQREKLSVKFKGGKRERDRVISLYESHEMTPCLFPYDGKMVKVRLPETITITDYREIKQIIGYSCEMDLEIV